MPHAKFQSPSINIDRDFQLSATGTQGHGEGGRDTVSEGPKMWSSAFAQRAKAELKIVCFDEYYMKQRESLGLKGERIDQYALEKQYKVGDEGISV